MTKLFKKLHQYDDAYWRAMRDLADYPNVPTETLCRYARLLGDAGEAALDSLLWRHGLMSSPLPSGVPADRQIQIGPMQARVQVKTKTRPGPYGYQFSLRRGYRLSPGGCRDYAPGDYDIVALVALPINTILFSASQSSSILMRTADLPRLAARPLDSLFEALEVLQRRAAETSDTPDLD